MTYVHLHQHSHFSLLDGHASPGQYAEQAAALEQPATALTDHGSLSGAMQLWKAAQGTGVKPIVGLEAYFAPRGRHHKEPVRLGTEEQRRMDVGGNGAHTHFTLLARTAEGLRNLFRLQEAAYREGFYRKPRVDLELLEQHREGLVALTGCAGGLLSTHLRLGQREAAEAHLRDLKDVFEDSLYVELMFHGINEPDLDEMALNAELVRVAEVSDVPTVMTNDAHYCNAEDAETHDALLCVQTRAKISDQDRFRFNGSGFHLASADEMRRKSEEADIPPEALHNTLVIADSVESYDEVFQHQLRMPKFEIPEDWSDAAAFADVMEWENVD
jgi:DNA polymerase III subunit alpha